ncbi:MAG: prepilin-type N-terminal cleavage/methylation domain-containing protein [Candidatus Zixiibacteriota bacterium]|nr:MAG: prepilin-type N-terminal cleavage/methylation domain-containing protein [candidate division Zixibacteria bacterium]
MDRRCQPTTQYRHGNLQAHTLMREVTVKKCMTNSGYTLLEVLIALALTSAVSLGALAFYRSVHNSMLVQDNIVAMQQNLRASMQEIAGRLVNAGANLPASFLPVEATDQPDTLTVRYAQIGGSLRVGDHTQKQQASPIHVAMGSDLSAFSVGQQVYLWHATQQVGEYFTITKIATNNGAGWEEIHHQGQPLLYDPQPGDLVIIQEEARYFIDAADTAHPRLMRQLANGTPEEYATDIQSLFVDFILSTGDTVQTVTASDTVMVVLVSLAGHTHSRDVNEVDFGRDGRRTYSLSTEVYLRNTRRS